MSKRPPTPRRLPLAVALAAAEAIVSTRRHPHRRPRRRRVFVIITEHGPVLLP